MSAISKNQATAVGGLTIDQLQAEAISPDELNVSLSGIYQALANLETGLGSQLSGAGAVPGELRVFNATQAPEKWTEVDRSTPVPLQFSGANRSIMCSWRTISSNTANTAAACVAGEHNGSVYYLYGIQTGSSTTAYLERMDVATGKTYYVATHPNQSFSPLAGFFTPYAVIVGDYLYAFGGKAYSNANAYQNTYRISLLNPGAGWTALQDMPNSAYSFASPAVVGTKFYVMGGLADYTYSAKVRVFDTVALTWTVLGATIPFGACENMQTATTADGNILCVGGWNGTAEIKKYCLFNTTTNTFGPVYDLPAGWADRPRLLFRLPGQNVRGCCYTSAGNNVIVEWNGSTWSDTGISTVLYGLSIGRCELSDGSHFVPASNCLWPLPHLKHAHAAASKARLLCAYTG